MIDKLLEIVGAAVLLAGLAFALLHAIGGIRLNINVSVQDDDR